MILKIKFFILNITYDLSTMILNNLKKKNKKANIWPKLIWVSHFRSLREPGLRGVHQCFGRWRKKARLWIMALLMNDSLGPTSTAISPFWSHYIFNSTGVQAWMTKQLSRSCTRNQNDNGGNWYLILYHARVASYLDT